MGLGVVEGREVIVEEEVLDGGIVEDVVGVDDIDDIDVVDCVGTPLCCRVSDVDDFFVALTSSSGGEPVNPRSTYSPSTAYINRRSTVLSLPPLNANAVLHRLRGDRSTKKKVRISDLSEPTEKSCHAQDHSTRTRAKPPKVCRCLVQVHNVVPKMSKST